MDESIWLQLGAVGIMGHFCLSVIKEVLAFKASRNGGAEAGRKAAEFWMEAQYTTARRAIKDEIEPMLTMAIQNQDKMRSRQHDTVTAVSAVDRRVELMDQSLRNKIDAVSVKVDSVARA